MSLDSSLIWLTWLRLMASSEQSQRSTDRLDWYRDENMAELTAISINTFDSTDYKHWSLEIEILLEQYHVLGSVDGREE